MKTYISHERGLDWDAMSKDEREAFIQEIVGAQQGLPTRVLTIASRTGA
jgi:hypothetical protein